MLNYIFSSTLGKTSKERLTDCYHQLVEKLNLSSEKMLTVVHQTVFIDVNDAQEYLIQKSELVNCLSDIYGEKVPPTSIVAQKPDINSLVVEFTVLENALPYEIEYKKNKDNHWIVFRREKMKMLFTAGLGLAGNIENLQNQSETAFAQLEKILKSEDMNFSDIVRQWNYIENIVGTIEHGNLSSQNYQIFNDVRSKFYNTCNFENGFPAATGIGVDFGGIVIDVIAAKFENSKNILPIKSPVQLDAHNYSTDVLADNKIMFDFCKTTPKFERAKVLRFTSDALIFVSGTAAITGQQSDVSHSIVAQTELTIENMFKLISVQNLQNYGVETSQDGIFQSIRVYVKFEKDMEKIKQICLCRFPDVEVVFLIADVCRPELLVEIEGNAIMRYN